MTERTAIFYVHGLGGRKQKPLEKVMFRRLEKRGFEPVYADLDWYKESYDTIHHNLSTQLEQVLGWATLTIICGRSAGASEATNLFARYRNEKSLGMISFDGRQTKGNLSRFDPRTLAFMARKSSAFEQSVVASESVLPSLLLEEKVRIVNMLPYWDNCFPIHAGVIPGATEHRIPIITHGLAALVGAVQLPTVAVSVETCLDHH